MIKIKSKPHFNSNVNKIIHVKPSVLGASCVSDDQCDVNEKCYLANNQCYAKCTSNLDCENNTNLDHITKIWQCNLASQVCLDIPKGSDGMPVFSEEPVVHSFGGILDAWENKNKSSYWDNIAWAITNKIALFSPLMPIKCDFTNSQFQDVERVLPSGSVTMKVGHSECKYTNATKLSGKDDWAGKRASCVDVPSQHYNTECQKRCEKGFNDGIAYNHQSGCDGGVPWCWCIPK